MYNENTLNQNGKRSLGNYNNIRNNNPRYNNDRNNFNTYGNNKQIIIAPIVLTITMLMTAIIIDCT